ncbi:acid phosphatase 1-like [Telopea speciosissima]|uniref:acid phosphatase 1-like n=1 Tax=Telopea speciosissima TaxID=54955 RepID=UPI001CC4A9B6|nr:acid phosphatase 1-like [Telopea speciosissima]
MHNNVEYRYTLFATMPMQWKVLVLMFLAIFSKASGGGRMKPCSRGGNETAEDGMSYCLSWRVGVETNNVRWWWTVPPRCLRYLENYMLGGQYERDLNLVMDQISSYLSGIVFSNDSMDAWILDIDDTCLSNLLYYRDVKHFGCDPYDPISFKKWAMKGGSPAVPSVLELFRKLVSSGFKVFLVTGRDEATLSQATMDNLHNQGYLGYERLIMRSEAYKGQSAVVFKSEIRKELEGQGYRIWGNVGDQWSDLTGDCLGARTFKLPNPMYFVP